MGNCCSPGCCFFGSGQITKEFLRSEKYFFKFNSIALRKAKIVYNFGLTECNRIKKGTRNKRYLEPRTVKEWSTKVESRNWM